MKNSKMHFSLFLMLLLSVFAYAQNQATLVLGIAQEIEDAKELVANLNGEITSTTWDKDYVHVEMRIKANDINLEIAKYLISMERFCMRAYQFDNGSVVLFMPNYELPVYINGVKLSEETSYQIFVPEGVTVRANTVNQLFPCSSNIQPLAKYEKAETEDFTAKKVSY